MNIIIGAMQIRVGIKESLPLKGNLDPLQKMGKRMDRIFVAIGDYADRRP